MIVDPDFLDHWRTGMVVDALDDPTAPLCILRLWAHCQERKSDKFAMPTRGLKAQCKFQGDAEAFEKALSEAGFIERDGENIVVCGWAEKNASLIAAWENGKTGGRPRKEKNPAETHGKPTGNPTVTQGKPSANPSATQTKPIREEKIREEKTPTNVGEETPRKRSAPPSAKPAVDAQVLIDAGFPPEVAAEFIAHKAAMKAPLTDRAWADHLSESQKAGWSPLQAAEKVMAKSWKGFEAKYVANERPLATASPVTYADHDEQNRRRKWEEMTGRKWPEAGDVFDVTPTTQRIAA